MFPQCKSKYFPFVVRYLGGTWERLSREKTYGNPKEPKGTHGFFRPKLHIYQVPGVHEIKMRNGFPWNPIGSHGISPGDLNGISRGRTEHREVSLSPAKASPSGSR